MLNLTGSGPYTLAVAYQTSTYSSEIRYMWEVSGWREAAIASTACLGMPRMETRAHLLHAAPERGHAGQPVFGASSRKPSAWYIYRLR